MLVLIPERVNGEPLTIETLADLIENPMNGGHGSSYPELSEDLTSDCVTGFDAAHWVLISKELIGGSRNQTYANQISLVDDLKEESLLPYRVPTALDMVVSILMYSVLKGVHLYEQVYTRCSDRDENGDPVMVGGFEDNLIVDSDDSADFKDVGIAAALVFET